MKNHTTKLSSRPGLAVFLYQTQVCGPSAEICRSVNKIIKILGGAHAKGL